MARSWSDAARALLDAYPWKNAADKARAVREAELVSFGECVEPDDLPIAVRRWAAKRPRPKYAWNGESWQALMEGFQKAILAQVLARTGGNASAAARLLKTTPRVVAYTARRLGLQNS